MQRRVDAERRPGEPASRVVVISSTECRGNCVHGPNAPGFPRNVGMRRACGRYVALMDDDDCMFPHRLERQMDVMLSSLRPAFVASDALVVDKHVNAKAAVAALRNKTTGFERFNCRPEWLRPRGFHEFLRFPGVVRLDRLVRGQINFIICSSVLLDMRFLRKHRIEFGMMSGPWANPPYWEDLELWLTLFEKADAKMAVISEALIMYDMNHGKRLL